MSPEVWGIIIGFATVNLSVLGLLFKVVSNGKPRKLGNPHPTDPDDIRLGDISLAYFKQEFVKPIVDAIEASK